MSDQGPSRLGQLVDHGPLYPGLSHPGQLVDPRGPRTHVRTPGTACRPWGHWTRDGIARDSWLNPRALGPCSSRAGELVETAGPQTWARVARDSWSTPQVFGPNSELPGTAF